MSPVSYLGGIKDPERGFGYVAIHLNTSLLACAARYPYHNRTARGYLQEELKACYVSFRRN